MKIDHIGIAVKSLAEATQVYEHALGLKVSGYDEIEDQGVRIAMLNIGESRIELLEPTGAESPIEKFMSKRGEGIHHIALDVDDIENALERLKAAGVRLVDSAPRRGAHNTRTAFIHPSSTHGVLLELVQHGE
ncbi:MAG: methylmalonyl-CoA epimerase [Acidobacteria bacterium]|nr:MAG: methylmalonyl-CoA epimerase [Acidobacteriota bacterium]